MKIGCDKFINENEELRKTKENTNIESLAKAAYQMVSILIGTVKRGTAKKKLKCLNIPIAGKTGTTNKNFDAWFIGFSSNLVIGVCWF